MNVQDAYSARKNTAIELANYFSDADKQLDKNNIRFNNDQLLKSMAEYLNNANKVINENVSPSPEAGLLKKSIFNLITAITGGTLAIGNGMDKDKLKYILKQIYSELDPDELLE